MSNNLTWYINSGDLFKKKVQITLYNNKLNVIKMISNSYRYNSEVLTNI